MVEQPSNQPNKPDLWHHLVLAHENGDEIAVIERNPVEPHILWQFRESVDGMWWMGVLQNGRWIHFEMDLTNRKHREAFFQGMVPDGVKIA